jgi:hypothetical protein
MYHLSDDNTNLKVMFWHLNLSTHCSSFACIHAIGMRVIGNQEHLVVSAFPTVRRKKQTKIVTTLHLLVYSIREMGIFKILPTQADN